MKDPRYPLLYQINTRVLLTALSQSGHRATLDDIPDAELDRLRALGFDWVWLLSVWSTGPVGVEVSRKQESWRHEYKQTLADLAEEDIGGSGFAIAAYEVPASMGGNDALIRIRKRLHARGMKLMLDFVPNHMGPDHAWVHEHPEYFVSGSTELLTLQPQNYKTVAIGDEEVVLAHGRDPYFDGWPDTFQLDYSNPETVRAMSSELMKIARLCDGVRCDMAMLVLPDVFERTWGRRAVPFWSDIISAVKDAHPEFQFMAEVYWDREWEMQQLGFDWTYDKRLYDRLRAGQPRPVREHLHAAFDYQRKLVRFLENHDEPRAASVFPIDEHKSAAVVTYTIPGLRFVHQGQMEGYRIRITPHLVRGPREEVNHDLESFYTALLMQCQAPVLKDGEWHWLEGRPAWAGNETWDAVIAHLWVQKNDMRLIIVNYAPHASQCYLPLPVKVLAGNNWLLHDLLSGVEYVRSGDGMVNNGLYLDMHAWQNHVFGLEAC